MRKFRRRVAHARQNGATFAEYLPITSIVLLSMAVAAAHYGTAIQSTTAALAAHLAGQTTTTSDPLTATGTGGPAVGGGPGPVSNEAPPPAGATDFGPYLEAFSQGFWRGAIERFSVLAEMAQRHPLTARQFSDIAAGFYLDPTTMQALLREGLGVASDLPGHETPEALAQWLAERALPADLASLASAARAHIDLPLALGPFSSLCASAAGPTSAGCDTLAKAADMGQRVSAILAEVEPDDHPLLASDLDVDFNTKLAMLDRAALATAWSTLHVAGYPQARQSPENLVEVADLLEHPDLVASGFDQNSVRSLIIGNNGPEGAELEQLVDGLDQLVSGDATFENVDGLVRELELGGNFSVGTRFILRDLSTHAAEFNGARVVFEIAQEAAEGVGHIDMEVEIAGQRRLLEYTSVKLVPPPGFAKAFASDLSNLNVSSLAQLNWRFDAEKIASLPRGEMLDALSRMQLDEAVLAKFGAADTADLVAQIDSQFETIFVLR